MESIIRPYIVKAIPEQIISPKPPTKGPITIQHPLTRTQKFVSASDFDFYFNAGFTISWVENGKTCRSRKS